ncbi:MAG: ABC transporter permease [Clostridiales bacterium]|jgi:hypothetical protein|nr:ABC transporter permease [Clostridiales bacterium]
MANLLKSDIYRFGKSKLLYAIVTFTGVIALMLTMLIRQDVRLGISVFGNLTAFASAGDIIRLGAEYHKGLGILAAILISVFIGQEYQWGTWQNKWITNNSRMGIYLSKTVISSAASISLFLIFEIVTLAFSGQVRAIMENGYFATVVGGAFVYGALGASICLLSFAAKNNIASTVICICYIIFSEAFASVIGYVSNFSENSSKFIGWIIRHSVYGMSIVLSSASVPKDFTMSIIINSLVITLLATVVGLMIFRKSEL